MGKTRFMVWVSKYALSEGIKQAEVRRSHDDDGRVYETAEYVFRSYKLGRDAHLERADAVKQAKAMRVKRIASLKKQIKALEALEIV